MLLVKKYQAKRRRKQFLKINRERRLLAIQAIISNPNHHLNFDIVEDKDGWFWATHSTPYLANTLFLHIWREDMKRGWLSTELEEQIKQ